MSFLAAAALLLNGQARFCNADPNRDRKGAALRKRAVIQTP
ncbi:MAG TPA: hypothetical protein PKK06_11175 [Phycisphaerae bacterium]|nr:hypothetical protein [Phycisphaerae bacterium]HNU45801.1 hypothetical protein [Phycisphaerae bacterium]